MFITSLELFDPSNGFIVNDTCIFEAEIAVTKPKHVNQLADQVVNTHAVSSDQPIGNGSNPLPGEFSVASCGELVDLKGFGKIEEAFVPLPKEVCAQHPSLIDCQKKRSRRFTEWAFTALGQVLHFFKTRKAKT
ncbi:uncharacterized protein LOC130719310 [Lotus japonicus]|uniref:uncharacterized protein LOC130719310 n=1 Tax=Lotus japonicus TaxID=34305 RepID=UPI00258644DA|nr:uncharacterized protein LOC130719310 [Lotus japonicus]